MRGQGRARPGRTRATGRIRMPEVVRCRPPVTQRGRRWLSNAHPRLSVPEAPDRDAIVRVVQLYVDGFNEGSLAKFKEAIHQDAWMFCTEPDGELTAATFLERGWVTASGRVVRAGNVKWRFGEALRRCRCRGRWRGGGGRRRRRPSAGRVGGRVLPRRYGRRVLGSASRDTSRARRRWRRASGMGRYRWCRARLRGRGLRVWLARLSGECSCRWHGIRILVPVRHMASGAASATGRMVRRCRRGWWGW
jgi:Putative lumazine-binding